MLDQLTHILETLKMKQPQLTVHEHAYLALQKQNENNGLSCRQMDILPRVAEGMSNKEIAVQIHVSDQTVKNHMTYILGRLHGVVLAYRLRFLSLEAETSR
jgi:DNA-binding NarL/FixJ family response regulator